MGWAATMPFPQDNSRQAFSRRTPTAGSRGSDTRLLRRGAAALLVCSGLGVVVFGTYFQRVEVQFRSEPQGATVWLDGVFTGVTPTVAKAVPRGPHLIVVTKHGFESWRETVLLRGQRQTVEVELRPRGRSSLTVRTTPPGATVLLDGSARGRTPLTIATLEPGQHQLRLIREGFVAHEETLSVERSRPMTVHRALRSEVERLFLRRLDKDPKSLADILELGHHYVLKNEFDKAEETLKRAAKVAKGGSSMPDAEQRIYQELEKIHAATDFEYGGYKEVRKGQAMAIRVLKAIIEANERNAHAAYYLGRMLAREGRHTDALAQLRRARGLAHDSRLTRLIQREIDKLY